MRHRTRYWPAAIFLIAVACADGTGPGATIDDTEAADIVLDADAMASSILLDHVLFAGFAGFAAESDIAIASADVRQFSRQRDCPLGGSISVAGQVERTITDEATEFSASASGSWNACVRGTRRSDRTHTIDGSFAMSAFRRYVDRRPSGPQTASKSGSFTVTRSDGESRTCEFDITSTRYPDENKRVVVGTICGRDVNREVSWRHADG
jgi:hypothetical protein